MILACQAATEIAEAMGNAPTLGAPGAYAAKQTYLRVEPKGPVLEIVARLPLLLEEMLFLEKATGGLYWADWEQSNKYRSRRVDLCGRLRQFQQLLTNGGVIKNLFFSLDDILVTTTTISDCHSGATVEIPMRTFESAAEMRHQRAIQWEMKKNLYIYAEEPLGCYLSEFGTVPSPWGNRVAETHSRWSHPDSMKWVSRTTYSAEGDFDTYFHFETESDCKQFHAQAKKRGR